MALTGQGPLGILTKSASPGVDVHAYGQSGEYQAARFTQPVSTDQEDRAKEKRVLRYKLLASARKILPDERVGKVCLRRFKPGAMQAEIWIGCKHPRAHYKGLMVCGSVWMCPVCSAKISRERADELTEGVKRSGLTPIMATFTLQHHMGDRLEDLLCNLGDGMRSVFSGKQAQVFKEKYKIVGSVSAWEYTYGENGHHPHKHVLLLSELSAQEAKAAENEILEFLSARYARRLHAHGYLINDHTVNVKSGGAALAAYVAKWTLELEVTQASQKEGRNGHYTAFQLLALIDAKQEKYIPVFREYAQAFKGKRQLVFSPGLRERLAMGKEKTDEEIAEEGDQPAWMFGSLDPKQFYKVRDQESAGSLGELLERYAQAGKTGEVDNLYDWLKSEFGIVLTDQQKVDMEYPWLNPVNAKVNGFVWVNWPAWKSWQEIQSIRGP